MFLALLAYLIRDWRHLQLAITLPGILTLPLIWYACVSFRYQLLIFERLQYNESVQEAQLPQRNCALAMRALLGWLIVQFTEHRSCYTRLAYS